jgi:hypothetical protein
MKEFLSLAVEISDMSVYDRKYYFRFHMPFTFLLVEIVHTKHAAS